MVNDNYPFGAMHESFFHIKNWLIDAIESAGAEVTSSGAGFGEADIQFSLGNCPFHVTVKPIKKVESHEQARQQSDC